MWIYEKKLEYPVRVSKKDVKMAKYLITQYGGPDLRFFSPWWCNRKKTLLKFLIRELMTSLGKREQYR